MEKMGFMDFATGGHPNTLGVVFESEDADNVELFASDEGTHFMLADLYRSDCGYWDADHIVWDEGYFSPIIRAAASARANKYRGEKGIE